MFSFSCFSHLNNKYNKSFIFVLKDKRNRNKFKILEIKKENI